MKVYRRTILKKIAAAVAGVTGISLATQTKAKAVEKEALNEEKDEQDIPLYSASTKFVNFVFVAGKDAHFEGDITAHPKRVLDELEKELIKAGSSMEKVL